MPKIPIDDIGKLVAAALERLGKAHPGVNPKQAESALRSVIKQGLDAGAKGAKKSGVARKVKPALKAKLNPRTGRQPWTKKIDVKNGTNITAEERAAIREAKSQANAAKHAAVNELKKTGPDAVARAEARAARRARNRELWEEAKMTGGKNPKRTYQKLSNAERRKRGVK